MKDREEYTDLSPLHHNSSTKKISTVTSYEMIATAGNAALD
jgi:hypothetical protein